MSKQRQKKSQIIDFNSAKSDNSIKRKRQTKVEIVPQSLNQEQYFLQLSDWDTPIVFGVGPAGTGKTLLATQTACKALMVGSVNRIIVTRPAVSVEEQHGFLPGDLNDKMAPWVRPIRDCLELYWSPFEINKMMEDGVIEICPLAYMRGRTFSDSYIIADEMQNSTVSQTKMLLTRIGSGSQMVITGDVKQHDRGYETNGLMDFLGRIEKSKSDLIKTTFFDGGDVKRHPVVSEVLSIYGED